ncbi:hypothetical protein IFO69_20445 [Echinicola sp. CAU 1574]|uniref:Uncharacterized protein n=1 Tax=Echinicola arenosa TaxID=2774144 RepID=A0ABR9ARZ6_9BACT|nr:hypothetical protein [Echinicola arenosa]MBD8491136.1 hypothetical protein [Echinicola arenosa]
MNINSILNEWLLGKGNYKESQGTYLITQWTILELFLDESKKSPEMLQGF